MQLSLFLLLPDLFAEQSSIVAYPALHTLLSRGTTRETPATSREAALCVLFDPALSSDPPFAALSARADGLEPGNDYWLRADPVHLQAQRDDLILFDVTDLDIAEARQLLSRLNAHLRQDDLELIPGSAQRWYLRLSKPPSLTTTPISRAIGHPMGSHLPTGAQASLWLNRLTEIQMLLHADPLNEARESAGQTPINGLWLWGGGCLPHTISAPFDAVYANDALSSGLAIATNTHRADVPLTFAALPKSDCTLAVLDEADVDRLERDWFAPLLNAMRARTITRCELVLWTDRAWHVSVTPGDLWRFWRRSPLSALARRA